MGEYEIWVGGQTNKRTDRHADRQINTMTRPGLGAGPSKNKQACLAGRAQTLSYAIQPIGKIHLLSKIAITLSN